MLVHYFRSCYDHYEICANVSSEQYRGSELLREEQNRMLEERVEMLKSHIEGQNKDSQSKVGL